jgi:hypothetical protein
MVELVGRQRRLIRVLLLLNLAQSILITVLVLA